jgi:hypothetical protein
MDGWMGMWLDGWQTVSSYSGYLEIIMKVTMRFREFRRGDIESARTKLRDSHGGDYENMPKILRD